MTNPQYSCMKLSTNKTHTHVGKELLTHPTTVLFFVATNHLICLSRAMFTYLKLYVLIFVHLNIFKFDPFYNYTYY